MLGQHEDVREVDEERVGGVDRSRVADLRAVGGVEADVPRGTVDQPVHRLARAALGPVRLLAR